MPEFRQRDLTPWHSLRVSFRSAEDVEEFERRIGQTIPNYSRRTPFVWYPEAEIGSFAGKRYVARPPLSPLAPVFIVSKGRAERSLTSKHLTRLGVRHRVIVEEPERERYRRALSSLAEVVTLDPEYQRRYDTADELGDSKSKGPGPARNAAWDLAVSEGAEWHWVMDDNIDGFFRLNRNLKTPVADGTIFRVMEEFAARCSNVAMAGPNYFMFASRKTEMPPFVANTRIYSCNLIRNSAPYRWRGRYNEDTDLSLRMLKDGRATVLFNAFLQLKLTTQTLSGGCTSEFYAREGTGPKSEMQVRLHPDVSRLTERWGRTHHYVDYSRFAANPLGAGPPPREGSYEYGMTLIEEANDG